MMSKSLILFLLGAVSPLLLLDAGVVAKQPPAQTAVAQANSASATATNTKTPDITGIWKVSLSEAGKTATYVFAQQGNVLTGTMKGLPFGDLPVTGTIANDGKLSFSGKMRGMKMSFTGTLTGQTMKGTADLPIGRKTWTATK